MDHAHEMNVINDEIVQMRLDFEKAQEKVETEFNAKLICEYNKYQASIHAKSFILIFKIIFY